MATLAVVVGCSSDKDAEPSTPAPSASTSTSGASDPGQSGISPGGVTTSLSAAASSTEEEYFQACNAAKIWMSEKGSDLRAQVEPYLAMIQGSASGQPGTWNIPWSQLPVERQSAVIVAVTSAAEGGC